MARDKELKIVVRIKDMANRTLSKLGKAIRTFGKLARAGALGMGAMALAAGALIAKMVALDNTQEIAERQLSSVISSMTRFRATADELVPVLTQTARRIQAMGVASDDAVISGTALLATYQQIADDELPRAMEVMADISVLMGGDMRGAANMLGKAALGMTGELRRAGITIDDATAKSGNFKLILEAISEQIGAQNMALRRTGYGGLIAFNNEFSDLLETGGKVVKGVLGPIAEAGARSLSKLNAGLRDFVDSDRFKEWAKTAVPLVAAGFAKIIEVVGGAVKAGISFLGTMTEILKMFRQLQLGMKSSSDDATRAEIANLESRRKAWADYQKSLGDVTGIMDGQGPQWTRADADRLVELNSQLSENNAEMVRQQQTIRDTEQFIANMADAYKVVDNNFNTFAEDFRNEVETISQGLENWDLTGGAPGVVEPPALDDEALMDQAEKALDVLRDANTEAQLDILESQQGAAARAQQEFETHLAELRTLKDQAKAQGLINDTQWQEMEANIQQAHDLRMEELNKSHWQRIIEDTDAATDLAQQQVMDFGQGATDAFADWMANSIQGIKQGSKAMQKAMAGLIGGIAEQWGEYYVAKGIATIAEAFSSFPAINAGQLAAGTRLVAAGTALKALGSVLGGAGGADAGGGASGGRGGGGGTADAAPGQGSMEPQRSTSIILDVGEMREDDIVTDVPGYTRRLITELNDAFQRNVKVQVTGG